MGFRRKTRHAKRAFVPSGDASSQRALEIQHARAMLQRSWPRLQMTFVVLVTAAAGFLSSYLLRGAGMDAMLLRYPLAILIAYAIFLLQMWMWIRWRDNPLDGDPGTFDHGGGGDWSGGGGTSGGGGSSASWGPSADSASSGDVSVLDVVDGDAALPLLAAVVLAAVAAVALVAAGWVVWSAPTLMAELLVDAAIGAGLYRRMRRVEAQGWWWLCVRHTFWPLLGVIVFFAALGALLQHLVPEASTLMEALRAL